MPDNPNVRKCHECGREYIAIPGGAGGGCGGYAPWVAGGGGGRMSGTRDRTEAARALLNAGWTFDEVAHVLGGTVVFLGPGGGRIGPNTSGGRGSAGGGCGGDGGYYQDGHFVPPDVGGAGKDET